MPIHTTPNGWVLETHNTGYALGLNQDGLLTQRYFGARLPYVNDYPAPFSPMPWASDGVGHLTPEEYPAHGGLRYIDPCLKVTFADGVRDLSLVYMDGSVTETPVPELTVRLRDAVYPLQVSLHYRLHEASDLYERWVTLENLGEQPMLVERVYSAKLTLPQGDDYCLSHLYGRHIDEFHLCRERLGPGLKVLESRRLITSHHHAPWFALDRQATEESGEVWFGTLAWSGNWKITAEVTEFASTRLSLGLNDWDFAWQLKPGEPLVTPPAVFGYTQQGFGAASRRLHAYVRDVLLPHGDALHKVLYNSWEATQFAVDEASQGRLAELAAQMGVELFVMDDGWFHGRQSDNAGLGDWWPDEVKFPNGLGGLVRKVNALGMDFGLWVEPEMANPDSDLCRTHPDWVIHFPTRPRTESRNQLILNLARTDVQEHLIAVLDRLLSENNITFIKWDMNRCVSEAGWQEAPGDPRELWVRYVHGLYRVWGELRQRHPQVTWQSCASGGGRADLGILRLADQIWTSDNTEAVARLGIQEGFSQFLPAGSMEAWVTDWGKDEVPLEFRFHASMCGVLGVGGNLTEWSEEERTLAAECIEEYKEVRSIVQLGDMYRLLPAQGQPFSAVQYMSKDRSLGVLFAFRVHIPEPAVLPVIYPRGLEPEAIYKVEGGGPKRSGRAWMEIGFKLVLRNMQSRMLRIRRVG